MTDEYSRRPKASHIAVRRTLMPVTAERADEPITFDPVFVGPEKCDGCEPGLTVVIDGQVFVADLQGCDEEYCYYDSPTGVA